MHHLQNAINIFSVAVAAVDPVSLVHQTLSRTGNKLTIGKHQCIVGSTNRLVVIGAGKAAAAMALAVEQVFGDLKYSGTVVTKYGHGEILKNIQCLEAGHPLPDAQGVFATRQIIQQVSNLQPNDVVIFLLSGGASALLADCPSKSSLPEVQEVFHLLLSAGATITEMNTVRKHISAVKGGQLAKIIYPATVYSLILSDVIGDDLTVIGSGPTVPDTATFADALAVLSKFRLAGLISTSIIKHLHAGAALQLSDTPNNHQPYFRRVFNLLIGTNTLALQAASCRAQSLGYTATIVTSQMQGEAKELAAQIVDNARQFMGKLPACLLYGGESTVTVTGAGKGGRNMELALAAGILLSAHPTITILSAGTDGTDGPTDAAGAVVNSSVMQQAMQLAVVRRHISLTTMLITFLRVPRGCYSQVPRKPM